MTISLIVSHFLLFQYKAIAIEPWDKFNITTDSTWIPEFTIIPENSATTIFSGIRVGICI